MKACRDCKFVLGEDRGAVCNHPKSHVRMANYYTGEMKTVVHSVAEMRSLGPCQPEAQLFEAKEN